MTSVKPPLAGEATPDDSIPSLVGRLVDEGKQFARAEIKLYRARLSPRVTAVRNAAIFGVVALSLVHAILVALFVGLILVLIGPLGPGGATAVVVVGGLLIVALLGWLAFAQAKKAFGSDEEAKS